MSLPLVANIIGPSARRFALQTYSYTATGKSPTVNFSRRRWNKDWTIAEFGISIGWICVLSADVRAIFCKDVSERGAKNAKDHGYKTELDPIGGTTGAWS